MTAHAATLAATTNEVADTADGLSVAASTLPSLAFLTSGLLPPAADLSFAPFLPSLCAFTCCRTYRCVALAQRQGRGGAATGTFTVLVEAVMNWWCFPEVFACAGPNFYHCCREILPLHALRAPLAMICSTGAHGPSFRPSSVLRLSSLLLFSRPLPYTAHAWLHYSSPMVQQQPGPTAAIIFLGCSENLCQCVHSQTHASILLQASHHHGAQ